jgi:hypothetical protein
VVLQQFLPEDEARQSAAGWRGDRYELFEHQDTGRLLLVCVTDWDTPRDATEFFHSYTKLVALKYPGWVMRSLEDQSGHIWQQEGPEGPAPTQSRQQRSLMVRQHGHVVQIVEGALADDVPHLRTLLEHVTAVPAPSR